MTPYDKIEDLLVNVAAAPTNETEIAALREIIDILWTVVPHDREQDVVNRLEKISALAKKWADEANL